MRPQNDLNSHPRTPTTDAAVGAFARTFPAPVERQRTRLSTKRGRNKSKKLPLELLLIIFGLVYDDLSENPEFLDEWSERDLASPSLFPYAFASVCSAWQDAMSLSPKFWKRVAILIDPPATPLSAIVSQLAWSRDLDLEVVVTQRDLHDTNKDPHGRSHMVSIMNILCSHIHHIRTLRFDVVYSSSLPSVLTDFHGTATVLEQLHLQCREDDGGPNMDIPVPLTERKSFACPKLKSFRVDGRNYYAVCMRDPRWIRKIVTIESLTISHFNPRPGESFTTYEFLHPLIPFVCTRALHLTDLALRSSPETLQLHRPQGIFSLIFEDIHDFQVINEVFSVVGMPFDLWLTRCTLGEAAEELCNGYTGVLHLNDIDQDLVPLLWHWVGRDLHISNCPRFDDRALDMMNFQEDGAFIYAPLAEALHIHDCPNFSFAALRRFIESFDGPNDDNPTTVPLLHLSGNVPSLSEQDRAWFVANVPTFSCEAH